MASKSQSFGLMQFLLWIFACTVGWGLGNAIGWAAPDSLGSPVVGLTTGAVLGVAQWFILRNFVNDERLWVLATIGGLTLGSIIFYVGFGDASKPLDWLLGGAYYGLGLGLFRWYALRDFGYPSYMWLVISIAALALGWLLAGFVAVEVSGFWGNVLVGAVVGAVSGIFSGYALSSAFKNAS